MRELYRQIILSNIKLSHNYSTAETDYTQHEYLEKTYYRKEAAEFFHVSRLVKPN